MQLYQKWGSGTGVSSIFCKYSEKISFHRTPLVAASDPAKHLWLTFHAKRLHHRCLMFDISLIYEILNACHLILKKNLLERWSKSIKVKDRIQNFVRFWWRRLICEKCKIFTLCSSRHLTLNIPIDTRESHNIGFITSSSTPVIILFQSCHLQG